MQKKNLIFLLLNIGAVYSANSYSDVRIGIQGTQVKSHSFGSYLNDKYNPSDSKDLGGGYISGSFSVSEQIYTTVDFTSVTRNSSDISNGFFGIGYHYNFGLNSLYTSVGANMVEVIRYHNNSQESKFDETASSLEVGIKLQVTSNFTIQPQYRASFFGDGQMHDYRLINSFMLDKLFSIEAGVGYNKFIDAEQFNWQTGVRLSF